MATPPGINQLDPGDFPALPDKEKLVRAINPFLGATAAALRAGLTFKENFYGHIKVLEVTCPEDWATPTLATGWAVLTTGVDPQPFAVRKTVSGDVQARGRLDWTAGGTPGGAQLIASLGADYAASHREVFDIFATDGANYVPATISINSAGELRWETISAGYRALSFSGDVWWSASNRAPPSWPVPVDFALPDTFTAKPGAVLVLRCEETGSNAPVGAVSVDGWTLVTSRAEESRQVIRLPRVNGLAAGYRYRLTLLVLPE